MDQSNTESFLLAFVCKSCRELYTNNYDKKCFVLNMQLECSGDYCIKCRLYKAAKLECAIVDLAKELGLVIDKVRPACTALMKKPVRRVEDLSKNIKRRLDDIDLTYPTDKIETCPFDCDECKKSQAQAMCTSDYEFVYEIDMKKFDVSDETIEMYMSGKLGESNDKLPSTSSLSFHEDHFSDLPKNENLN